MWANHAEIHSIHPNPWTSLSMMKVVETGASTKGKWIVETHNLLEDYRSIFKSDPPKINSIAIMTDSDNTKGQATAYDGDIVFKKK